MTEIQINGRTAFYGIIGNPIAHSFSPAMQTAALQSVGENAVYLPFQPEESQLESFLKSFDLIGLKGFNVTVPYKEKIIPFLQEISEEAKLLGSVNTVVKTANGWKGYTTDGAGLVQSLVEQIKDIKGKNFLLLGAGGAAKAIALELVKAGAESLTINNRTQEKANELKKIIEAYRPGFCISINPATPEKYDCMINCTSVGMKDDSIPTNESFISASKFIVDIIYNPAETALLKKAKELGIPTANGIGMLLYQGVKAFKIWTDKKAPVQLMERELLASLKKNKA